MKHLKMAVMIAMCALLISGPLFAEWAKAEEPQPSEETLKNMNRDEQSRRVEQLARSFTNLERKMDRLEDRLERLDEDFKEFKRNINSRV